MPPRAAAATRTNPLTSQLRYRKLHSDFGVIDTSGEGHTLKRRAFYAAFLVAIGAVLVATIGFQRHDSGVSEKRREALQQLKAAMSPGRIDKVRNSREASREGANGPAQELYSNSAYPSPTISLAQTRSAQN